MQHGVVKTAANIDKSWIDCEIEKLLEDRLQHDVVVVNDADAAGVGELYYGAAKGQDGLVILTTLGTGIGTAILYRGVLVPNSELGHLEIDGNDAETVAACSAKTREDLSYEEWAKRLQRYYRHLEDLIWPDLFVVGGGVSRKARQVPAPARPPHADRAGRARERGRHHRRGPAGDPDPGVAGPAQGLTRRDARLTRRRGTPSRRRRRGRGCGCSSTRAGRPG